MSKITRHAFRNTGDDIVLLGTNTGEFGGSEYLYVTADLVAGQPPSVDLDGERVIDSGRFTGSLERCQPEDRRSGP